MSVGGTREPHHGQGEVGGRVSTSVGNTSCRSSTVEDGSRVVDDSVTSGLGVTKGGDEEKSAHAGSRRWRGQEGCDTGRHQPRWEPRRTN